MDDLFKIFAFHDEPIDPELQGAIKEFSSPIRVTKQSQISNNDQYKVLTSEEIVQYVVDFVQEVNSIVQLKLTVTRMLLSYCKWDKILLMEKFYNDPEKLFKEARVINPLNIPLIDTIAESANNECEICYAELSSSSTATNACGHKFCTACWSEYLKVKIMDEGVGNSILCAATDCDFIIDDETVIQLVDDLQVKRRYQHLITNSFVQQNLLLRWCPAPGCDFAIKVDYSPVKPISCECKCGHEFCFDCGENWHGPVPCDLLKRFNDHIREGIFRPFMLRHMDYDSDDRIKTCPNPACKVSIQKIFGCPVMQCKNCSTIFCWVCLNRYKTKAAVYHHFCSGEPKSGDESKSTVAGLSTVVREFIAAGEQSFEKSTEDKELAPPQKYVKLTTNQPSVSTAARSEVQSESSEPTEEECRGCKKKTKKETLLPKLDVNHLTLRVKDEIEFPVYERQELNGIDTRLGHHQRLNNYYRLAMQMRLVGDRQLAYETLNVGDVGRIGQIRPPILRRPMDVEALGELRRPNNYYKKYDAEDANFQTAIQYSAQIKHAMHSMEKSENLVQFELASILLVQCRQTLKYSAIFAMYLKNVDQALLFKNLYLDLEVATNMLSESMNKVHLQSTDTHAQIPESIIPAQRNCKLRRRALLDCIDEGYDNEWWFFEDQPT